MAGRRTTPRADVYHRLGVASDDLLQLLQEASADAIPEPTYVRLEAKAHAIAGDIVAAFRRRA